MGKPDGDVTIETYLNSKWKSYNLCLNLIHSKGKWSIVKYIMFSTIRQATPNQLAQTRSHQLQTSVACHNHVYFSSQTGWEANSLGQHTIGTWRSSVLLMGDYISQGYHVRCKGRGQLNDTASGNSLAVVQWLFLLQKPQIVVFPDLTIYDTYTRYSDTLKLNFQRTLRGAGMWLHRKWPKPEFKKSPSQV